MCIGSRSGSSPFGGLLGINQPSPYAGNYGYARADSASPITDEERQWYQSNNFGDPLEQVQYGREKTGQKTWMTSGRNTARVDVTRPVNYYRGVSNEARYLYGQAKANALAIQQASANPVSSRNPGSSQGGGGASVNYTYAGNALSIPAA